MELSNLEICKHIAEIEGYVHAANDTGQSFVQVSPDTYLVSYDPTADKTLCWDLMVKHEIKLSRNRDNEYVGMWSHCRGEDDKDPQVATCLAIIAKHERG